MDTEEIKNKFISYLKRNGHRVTEERLNVLKYIFSQATHIDADALFIQMKTNSLKVSRATVYNTLQLLIDSKIITKSTFGEPHQHYEPVYGLRQHHHLICEVCGKVIEFENQNIETIQKSISKKYNFISNKYLFQIMGICEKCSKKN
jgi:Fur family ferric uptake transcriptional regulator